ncbi:hypothetical protein J3P77_14780 [Pseudomonas sp. R1-18]|uniref:Imm15 family immunity protein n=1 Tax=Pseudomonas sp. R1-18 TaxID=1632772 RepID=UPI003DA8641B
MKFSDIQKKIISKEPYNDANIFVEEYESFEEIPLASRYSRLKKFRKELGDEGVHDLLISLSIFLLNTALIVSGQKAKKDILYAITFTDFDYCAGDGFIIPSIFIYPDGRAKGFLEKIRLRSAESSNEINTIKRMFERNGAADGFDFLESRFHDSACNEEIIRVFVIPKKRMME